MTSELKNEECQRPDASKMGESRAADGMKNDELGAAGVPKKSMIRVLFLVATPKLARKAITLFQEKHIPILHEFRAQGTASEGIIDWLGLDGVDKAVVMTILPVEIANGMLRKLYKKLQLGAPNSGVAFTIRLSGASNRMIKLSETLQENADGRAGERSDMEMAESEYRMIAAIVNQGYSDEVMDAARPAGARGGTVFHSRRVGSEEAKRFWGINVQQEREIVLILAEKSKKKEIMCAIGEKCGLKSEAQGMVLSLPVDGVVGLD